jgi:hypothetical protein
LTDSWRRKRERYPELVGPAARCKLVFAGMEVGGRWAPEAYDFVCELAAARTRDAPQVLQRSAYTAWVKRWTTMLAVAGMRAFADTQLHGDARSTDVHEGRQLTLGELLGAEPHEGPPEASRLPLRGCATLKGPQT